MTMMVVDASVAVKWFLPEPDAEAAMQLLDDHYRLAAPDLIYAEIGNTAWKLHLQGVLDAEQASRFIEQFLSMPLEIHDSTLLLVHALEVAIATKRPVYDSLYLALAEELGGTVITADERWFNALAGHPLRRFLRLLR